MLVTLPQTIFNSSRTLTCYAKATGLMQTYLGDHTVEVTRHDEELMEIIVTSTFSEKHPHTLDCIYEDCEVGCAVNKYLC